MRQKRFHKIISLLLTAAYLNLVALTIFHFHTNVFNNVPDSISSSTGSANAADPFSDSESNCSVTQFSTYSYINEIDFPGFKILDYNSCNYESNTISSRPLQVIQSSNSLRAPPQFS